MCSTIVYSLIMFCAFNFRTRGEYPKFKACEIYLTYNVRYMKWLWFNFVIEKDLHVALFTEVTALFCNDFLFTMLYVQLQVNGKKNLKVLYYNSPVIYMYMYIAYNYN